MVLVTAAVVLVSLGLPMGSAQAAAPSVPISGTVRATTPDRLTPAVLPSGSHFVAATTSCTDETRTFPTSPTTTATGVLLSVDATGSYAGSLVAGCTYNVLAVSLVCGPLVPSPSVTVAAVTGTTEVRHFVIPFPTRPALAAESGTPPSGTTMLLEDTSRAVDLWPCSYNATRRIPTTVLLPEGAGPHPVVVVGHGLGSNRFQMHGRGQQLAANGFVAVIPSFAGSNSPIVVRDLPNQPGDVSFVLRSLLDRNLDPADPLFGTIEATRIGYSGVSGGAITGLLFLNACCREPRIKAIHADMGFFLGTPLVTTPLDLKHKVPVLTINNRADSLIPFANLTAGWNQLRGDKYAVSEPAACPSGGSHCLPLAGGTALVEFFDAYLNDDVAARASLVSTFSQPDAGGLEWRIAVGPTKTKASKPQ